MPDASRGRPRRGDSTSALVDPADLPPPPSRTNLDQLILRAFYWVDEGLQRNLRQRGGPAVTHAQSMIILTIGEGISRPSAIADRLGVSRQAVHQGLQQLVQIGIIELIPDPNDGRAKIAVLSSTGEPIFSKGRSILRELEQELGRRIGSRALKQLRNALELDWGEPADLGAPKPRRPGRARSRQ